MTTPKKTTPAKPTTPKRSHHAKAPAKPAGSHAEAKPAASKAQTPAKPSAPQKPAETPKQPSVRDRIRHMLHHDHAKTSAPGKEGEILSDAEITGATLKNRVERQEDGAVTSIDLELRDGRLVMVRAVDGVLAFVEIE